MAEALFAIFLRVIFFTCFMVFSEPFFNSVFFYSSDFLFFFKSVFFKEQNFRLIIFCQPLHALELLPMILKFQQKTPCLRPPAVLNFHQQHRQKGIWSEISDFLRNFFHGHFSVLTGVFLDFFSPALIGFSRMFFGDYFHGQKENFTCTFRGNFRFFHGHLFFHVHKA